MSLEKVGGLAWSQWGAQFAFEVESCPEAFWNTCTDYGLSPGEKAGWLASGRSRAQWKHCQSLSLSTHWINIAEPWETMQPLGTLMSVYLSNCVFIEGWLPVACLPEDWDGTACKSWKQVSYTITFYSIRRIIIIPSCRYLGLNYFILKLSQ